MIYPIISVAIATFNSEATLSKTLDSLKKQTYPQTKIEVLIIDGGSKDKTLSIAKKYKTKILNNPKTDLIYAKQIAFLKASGKYLLYLDSDEVLENPQSLMKKYLAFNKDSRVKSVMLGGYKSPKNYPSINNYVNEFGDPFSFFIYRESKGDQFFLKDWSNKYKNKIVSEDKNCYIFDFTKIYDFPLIELSAGGCMIDLEYCRKHFQSIKNNPDLITHLFYMLNSKNNFLAITKNDFTIHYSTPSFQKYFKKLASRIRNNVFNNAMGEGGFSGRERYHVNQTRIKKYFFIPYALTLFLPLVDAIYLVISRKKIIYICHVFLCLYTAILILYNYTLKLVNIKPTMKVYGT